MAKVPVGRRMDFNPDSKRTIHDGDDLVVLARPDSLNRLESGAR